MNLKTRIIYKNRDLKPISKCEYTLKDQAEMLSMDLKRIITDVEDLAQTMNNNTSKDEWSSAEIMAFQKVKHKLLDKAGEISRLPECIFDADQDGDSVSDFWNRIFDEEE